VGKRFNEFASRHWLSAVPWYYHIYRLPLLVFALLFIAGHWLGSWVRIPEPVWVISVTLVMLGPLLAGLHFKNLRGLAGLVFMVAALLLGIAYREVSTLETGDGLSNLASEEWQPCAVRAQVISAAVWQPNPHFRSEVAGSERWKTRWEVRCVTIRDLDRWESAQAICSLSVDGRIDEYLPGDVLQIHGHLRRITGPTNPGCFDFSEHARNEGKFVMLRSKSAAQITRIDSQWGWYSLARMRGLVVRSIDRFLVRWVHHDQAPLAAALVFGQRQQVDWQDQQSLMATGTLHMLAISGLHVEILAGLLLVACTALRAGPRTVFFLLVIVTWSYAGLSGLQPPVIRAAVQVTAFAFARWIGGKARLGNMLGAAAIVLFVMRSTNLQEVGVQLSFLAVGTIGLFASTTRAGRKRERLQAVLDEALPGWLLWLRWLRSKSTEMLQLSFWVTLFTCPLIWTNFNVIAPIAVLLNVLISIPLMVALLSGLATAIFGWFVPLGWVTGKVCGVTLALITGMVDVGHRIPLGHIWLPAPPMWWTYTFYLFALAWLVILGRSHLIWLATWLLAWIAFAMAPWMYGPRGQIAELQVLGRRVENPELRCTFLNVGHGTCVVLELPTGEVWLYDAGHMGAVERSHQDIASSLWFLQTARIDRLILSHADADHYNASSGLLERFSVGEIVSTRQFWEDSDRDVQRLISKFRKRRCKLSTWEAPSRFAVEEVQFHVLHPTRDWQAATDNANSLCLLVEFAGTRVLLPGDLEGPGISQLTTLPARPCQIVMAPHHGSLTHDPTSLLEWCRPDWVVISGSSRAARPEVVKRYSQNASQLAITHRDGAIQVCIRASGDVSVRRWLKSGWSTFED
jgi:competence protein ComEC